MRAKEHTQNEALIARALRRMMAAGQVPYVIAGDCNVDPTKSPVLTQFINQGLLYDEFAPRKSHEEQSINTYRRGGIIADAMDEKYCSRVDAALTNVIAHAAVTSARFEWEKAVSDHVPLAVTLRVGAFAEDVNVWTKPAVYEAKPDRNIDPERKKEILEMMHLEYGHNFQSALARKDFQTAHEIWCDLATTYLQRVNGFGSNKKGPPKGRPPEFHVQRRAVKAIKEHWAMSTMKSKRLEQARRRIKELKWRVRRANGEQWKQSARDNSSQESRPGSECTTDRSGMLRDDAQNMRNLWKNICDDLRHIGVWNTMNLNEVMTPMEEDILNIERVWDNEVKQNAQLLRKEKRAARTATLDDAWVNAHGKRQWQVARDDFRPPAAVLYDPVEEQVTANTNRILDMFIESWDPIYNKFQNRQVRPRWEDFQSKSGKYTKHEPANHDIPEVETYYRQVQEMKTETAPGLDGWTVRELKGLPIEIWELRRNLDLGFYEDGTLPHAFRHVAAPMIPKRTGQFTQTASRAHNILHPIPGLQWGLVEKAAKVAGEMGR